MLIAAGLLIAAGAGAARLWRRLRRSRLRLGIAVRRIPPRIVLIVLLALATPLGEAIYSVFGTNLLGARNLNASWPALAIAIGGARHRRGVSAGHRLRGARSLGLRDRRRRRPSTPTSPAPITKGRRELIEDRWAPGDVVVDAATLTPVPLTGLDVYLPQTHPEFRPGLPVSEHPFMVGDPVPPVDRVLDRAIAAGRGGTIFLVTHVPNDSLANQAPRAEALRQESESNAGRLLRRLPPGFAVTERRYLPGVAPLAVFVITDRG